MTNRMIAAALAAALALPAAAQSGGIGERARRATGQRQAPQPAQAAPQAEAGQPQGQPLNDAQRSAFGNVHALSMLAQQVGDLAATRGTTPDIQDLGKTLAKDHRTIDGTLAQLVKEHGGDLASFPAGGEASQLQGQVNELTSKNGADFDKAFLSFFTKNGNAFVDSLKRARDATSGKDARLKKFLDDTENASEGHLASARQLKSQRQARTPPAR